MRLYSLSKRHFVLVFVVFLVCFALTVFIGAAGRTRNKDPDVALVHVLRSARPIPETPFGRSGCRLKSFFCKSLLCGKIVLVSFAGPKILYEQEHNAEQLLVKNVSIKVRRGCTFTNARCQIEEQ